MKKLILIKTHSSVQFAHLYEHLYCTRIKELFHQHKLYKYVDYSLEGTTFDHGGLIEINIECYTPDAVTLAGKLSFQRVSLADEDISKSLMQILAEEEAVINTSGMKKIKQALTALDSQPWQSVDEFEIFDAKSVRLLTKKPVYADYSHYVPTGKLFISLLLDQNFVRSHRELIPLFRHIAKIISFTANDLLANEQGYYFDEVTFQSTSQKTRLKSTLKLVKSNHTTADLVHHVNFYKALTKELLDTEAFERFLTELQRTSYTERHWSAPNTYDNFNETAVYIGARGWQYLATTANLALILDNISVEVRFGNQKHTSKIGSTR